MIAPFLTADAPATRALGERFGQALRDCRATTSVPVLVTLSGELGAGKTTFVGGVLAGLGHVGPARSPTYTLIEPYRLAGRDVHHCDLYRLRHPDELEDLGLRELFQAGSVLLVEWPEKAGGRLGTPDVAIELRYEREPAREIRFVAESAPGAALLEHL